MAVDWGKIIGLAAPALANMAQAKTNNRAYDNNANIVLARDAEQAAIDREKLGQTQQELDLRAAADQRIAQNDAYAKSLHSAALMGAQDASFDRSGFKGPVADISFSGGLRPSMFGAAGQDAAAEVNRAAMQELLKPKATPASGSSSSEAVPRGSGTGTPSYQAPEQSGAGFWERALGIAGLAAPIVGELMKGRTGSPAAPNAPQAPDAQNGGYVRDAVKDVADRANAANGVVGVPTPRTFWGTANSLESPVGATSFRGSGSGMLGSQYTVPRSPVPSGPIAPSFSAPILTAQREQFAKTMGYRSLQDLNAALSSLGPQGQELARANVVATPEAPNGLTQWMQQVETLLGRR